MAIPVPEIDTRTSLLEIDKGKDFEFQPIATGSPTLWEAVGLPPGLTISSTTGRISGTPNTPGLYGVILKASNFDSRIFTANASTDILTVTAHTLENGDIVTLTTSTTLPAPLSTSEEYEVRDVSGDGLKLANKVGGAAINITDTGTGTHTIKKKQTDQIVLLIPILDTGSSVLNDDITFEMNVDVVTGKSYFLGVEGVEWGPPSGYKRDEKLSRPVLLVKKGDRFPVAIGFTRNGILQDLDLATLKFGAKEFVPEGLLDLTDGSFEKLGSGRNTRYKVVVNVSDSLWNGPLSNYEDDYGTYLDAFCEVEFTIVNKFGQGEINQSIAHPFQSLKGSQTRGQTFNFTGLPQDPGPIEYTLVLDLTVNGRSAQNAQVTKTFDVEYSGGAFSFTDTGGDDTDSPATEQSQLHWDSTLHYLSIEQQGDNGAKVTSKVEATDEQDGLILEIRLAGSGWYVSESTLYGPSGYDYYDYLDFELHEVYYDYGSYSYENWWGQAILNDGDSEATVEATLEAACASYYGSGNYINAVYFDDDENIIRINMQGSCPIHMMQENYYAYIGPFYRYVNRDGHSHNIQVTARLSASAEGVDDVFRKTSQSFILRIEDELIDQD